MVVTDLSRAMGIVNANKALTIMLQKFKELGASLIYGIIDDSVIDECDIWAVYPNCNIEDKIDEVHDALECSYPGITDTESGLFPWYGVTDKPIDWSKDMLLLWRKDGVQC